MLKKAKKSKTMWFAAALSVLGVVEVNLHLVQDLLGEYYGITYLVIAIAVAALRVVTTTSLEDK